MFLFLVLVKLLEENSLGSDPQASATNFKAIETEAAESVASCLSKEREKEILENRQHVKALLKTTALLGRQGLAFRGHDEGESSTNQGNFVETVHLLTEINPDLMKNSRKAYGHYMSHDATKNELRKMRDDEYFRVLYGKSKEMAINVGADLSETCALSSAIPVKSKRVQKISGRLRDYLTTTTIGKHNIDSESTTTEDKMRRVLREATRCLNPKSKDFMDSDLLLVIATYFDQAGIDTMQLKCQALIARAFVSKLPQKPANALDVLERLGGLKEAYSELLKVLRTTITLLIFSCLLAHLCEEQWKKLRETYCPHKRSLKKPSGAKGGEIKPIAWPHFLAIDAFCSDQLKFHQPRAGMTNYVQASSGSGNIQNKDKIATVSLSLEAEEASHNSSKETDADEASQAGPNS
ncbi:hypothetical protein QYM36_002257 [Artemia franciscana]|uniref:DUF4371 domain-containing protein n=1 Tax=Artemia franciscana TaxID=6661 RepID=A0AA88INF2_ARTSF|nr:hypothetical protein QYM36_002257 [Artemia franciscana]